MLEKRQRIGHKDHQSSPFKPALLTVVFAIKKKKLSHLNSFMDHHFSTKKQEKKTRENLHVMKKKQKKHYLYLSSFV